MGPLIPRMLTAVCCPDTTLVFVCAAAAVLGVLDSAAELAGSCRA